MRSAIRAASVGPRPRPPKEQDFNMHQADAARNSGGAWHQRRGRTDDGWGGTGWSRAAAAPGSPRRTRNLECVACGMTGIMEIYEWINWVWEWHTK